MKIIEAYKDDFFITTDINTLDINAIHNFLSIHSHWAKNIDLEKVKISMQNSLNFGLFAMGKQIGFARIISDFSTIAYLGDVYVLPEYRGLGLSKWLMEIIIQHPNLQGLRRWILTTVDAHGLYEQFGFAPVARPERFMEIWNPNVYAHI